MVVIQWTRLGLQPWPVPAVSAIRPNHTDVIVVDNVCCVNNSSRIRISPKLKKLPRVVLVSALDPKGGGGGGSGGSGGSSSSVNNHNSNNSNNRKGGSSSSSPSSSNSNYVVPLDKPPCITRPLAEILRDLNKRIPDNIIIQEDESGHPKSIPWYQANRMLSFYAPGWCGEIRDIILSSSEKSSVTVVYRVTIRGTDGEAHRESTGTVSLSSKDIVDPVGAAEEIAFCKACARFGLGLYLYHDP